MPNKLLRRQLLQQKWRNQRRGRDSNQSFAEEVVTLAGRGVWSRKLRSRSAIVLKIGFCKLEMSLAFFPRSEPLQTCLELLRLSSVSSATSPLFYPSRATNSLAGSIQINYVNHGHVSADFHFRLITYETAERYLERPSA